MPKFTIASPELLLGEIKKPDILPTFSLIDNDRPYSQEEEEIEKKATKYSLHKFPRIKPLPGTLGFLLRNLRGGNAAAMHFLLQTDEHNRKRFVKDFEIYWKNMDEFSRNRVDIFDILCLKQGISVKKFWGALQEGMFDHHDALSQISLSGHKAEFVELLKKMAKLPRNHADRKLLAEALGITKETPLVSFVDNSKHETTNVQVNNNNIPSFASSIRRSEKVVDVEQITLQEAKEPLALGEGKQDYIDAELLTIQENSVQIER